MTNFGRKILQRCDFSDQSFTRCHNSIQHFHSVWVLEAIYTQRFTFRINTTTRREILKQNLHNDVPFSIKNLTHCLLWNEKFTSCQNFESKRLHCVSLWKGWVILNFESKVYKMSEFVSEYLQRVRFRNKTFKTCPTLDQVAHNVSDLESKT